MREDRMTMLNLPAQVRDLLWRIFGHGASPLSKKSAFDLIGDVISKRTSLPRRERIAAIAEIRGWFDSHEDHHWLAAEMREPVAQAIVERVGDDFENNAVWAIAAVDTEFVLPLLKEQWSDDVIDKFCSRALAAVQRATVQERILDAARASGYRGLDPANAAIPREAIERDSQLATFQQLGSDGWDLVHHALDNAVSNLVELLVELRPARFESSVASLDHPVLQALAAERFLATARRTDHSAPLRWIKPGACEAVVALATYHTLGTVNLLDQELESAHATVSRSAWRTELKPGEDDFDSAVHGLVDGLVDRISALPPKDSARWLGELLGAAPDILDGNPDRLKPRWVQKLEESCIQRLSARLESRIDDDMLDAFRSGLSLARRNTWNRHIGDLAWAMRVDSAESARTLAQSALDCHVRRVRGKLAADHFHFDWDDWQDRNWIDAMGRVLLLSDPPQLKNRYCEWVRSRCRELPLTTWDAENRNSAFRTADRIAQHWFLVAVHAIRYGCQLGERVHAQDVLALVEVIWSHCRFALERGCIDADVAVATEAAARVVVDLGEVQADWLIGQAARTDHGARALWALADQHLSSASEEQHSEFVDKFGRAAASRFGDAARYSVNSLFYWAMLWLLLGAHGPAKQTATAIAAATSRPQRRTRGTEILILKLLALATASGRFSPELERHFTETYRDLWMPYTPDNENSDRAEVDAYLRQSKSHLQVAT